jgi:hypothetical protein
MHLRNQTTKTTNATTLSELEHKDERKKVSRAEKAPISERFFPKWNRAKLPNLRIFYMQLAKIKKNN